MKYWFFTILLFVCCNMLKAQVQIKVLTYNIFHGENPYKKGAPNLDDIASVINELKPDIVALQEVDSATGRLEKLYGRRMNWVQELAKKTGMYGYFGKAMDFDGGGYGEALLTRKPSRSVVEVLPNPSGGEPRSLIYAEITTGKTAQKFLFAGTHLCHQFLPNKRAQIERIDTVLTTRNLPVILVGDFNTAPGEAPYDDLLENWDDAAVLWGDPQYTFPTDDLVTRIDYIWMNKEANWKVNSLKVLPYDFSDHRPVFAILELSKNK